MRITLLSLFIFSSACASGPDLQEALADAREHANDFRADVNEVAVALNTAAPLITVGCNFVGEQSALCSKAKALHFGLSESVAATRRVIDAYDATALGYEQVKEAVRALDVSAAGFTHHMGLVIKVVNAFAAQQDPGPTAGGSQPSGPDAAPEGTTNP